MKKGPKITVIIELHRLKDFLFTAVKDTVQEKFLWMVFTAPPPGRRQDSQCLCTVGTTSAGRSGSYTVVTDRSELYTRVPSGDLVP